MTNKLSGRYCIISRLYNTDNEFYCIPVELKEKFKELNSSIWGAEYDQDENYGELKKIFDNTFKSYRLYKPLNKYSFTNFQEIEEQ